MARTESGDWGGAIEGFSQIYEAGGTPDVRKAKCAYNIGLCWSKVGTHEGAMRWFGEWLGMPGARADRRPEVLEMFWQAWKGVQVEQEIWAEADG